MFALFLLAAKAIADATVAYSVLGITTGVTVYSAARKASNSKK